MTDAFRRYRVLWPDQLGLARGKYLPLAAAKKGTSFSVAVFMQGYDRNLYNIEVGLKGAGLPDLEARFSLTDARPGWEPDTGVVVADLVYGDEPYPVSPRDALRRAIADWSAAEAQPRLSISLTGYVLQPDNKLGWVPISTPAAYLYGTGALADPSGLLYEIMATADSSGLAIESVSTDLDSPQFEIVTPFNDALSAVDNVFLVREMARELANERDLKITFLPKPFPDRAGSSMHVSMALDDAAGENLFFDAESPDRLSSLLRMSIGGILRHHEALTAICGPTVNSYKRMRQGDILGLKPTWGYDHRFATIRVPPPRGEGTRLQYRLADAAANPYLVAAVLLQAARLGDKSRLSAGKALNDHGDGDGDDGRTTPSTLDEAIQALRSDGELGSALGLDLVDNFCELKTIEWKTFVDAEPRWADKIDEFSEWERENYLPFH